MKGFWPKANDKHKSNCLKCVCYNHSVNPRLPVTGKGSSGLMFIIDYPDKQVDKNKQHHISPKCDELRDVLGSHGVRLSDCFGLSAVHCVVPAGKESKLGLACQCRGRSFKLIGETKPKVIIPLGTVPLDMLYGHRVGKLGGIHKWRGYAIPDRELGAWVVPALDQGTMEANEQRSGLNVARVLFKQDIAQAIALINKPLPQGGDEESCCRILQTPKQVERFLQKVISDEPPYIAFDYETTGLKPHRKGHKILSCAIATSPTDSTAFMMDHANLSLLKKILRSKRIKKWASNFKYEETWTRVLLGYGVIGWDFDTMIGAHVLDNSPGVTGLKFQAAVRYGVFGYDEEAKAYMQPKPIKTKKGLVEDKSDNAFNNLELFPVPKLLMYNAMDSLLEFRVAVDMKKEIKKASK